MFYYPTMRPPRSVFYQAVLYWDCLATMVTPTFVQSMDASLRRALDAQVFIPIDLAHYFNETSTRGDLEIVASLLERFPDASDFRPPAVASSDWKGIYTSKLPNRVRQCLLDSGLARPSNSRDELVVSPVVQTYLLSVAARTLAVTLSCDQAISFIPHTDSKVLFNAAAERRRYRASVGWEIEVGNLLPVPDEEVSVDDLLRFRSKYHDERQRMMRALHTFIRDLQRDMAPHDIAHEVRQELAQAVRDLERARGHTRWQWAQRGMLVSAAIGAAELALAVPPAAVVLTIAGSLAVNLATSRMEGPGYDPQAPYAYLHNVRRALSSSLGCE